MFYSYHLNYQTCLFGYLLVLILNLVEVIGLCIYSGVIKRLCNVFKSLNSFYNATSLYILQYFFFQIQVLFLLV